MNPQEQEVEDISEEHLDDVGVLLFSEYEIEEYINFYKRCFVTTIILELVLELITALC